MGNMCAKLSVFLIRFEVMAANRQMLDQQCLRKI